MDMPGTSVCLRCATYTHDDAEGNWLFGGPALDWFFANLDGVGNNGVKDHARVHAGEIVTKITH